MSIDLATKETKTLAYPYIGPIDGIRKGEDGSIYVSWSRGRLAKVSRNGLVEEIFNISNCGEESADFEHIVDRGLLIVPDLTGHRIRAFEIQK